MRNLVTASYALLVLSLTLTLTDCGGGSSSSSSASGPLSGNWQVNMTQQYPSPVVQLSASGFLQQSGDTLSGSFQGPTIISTKKSCGGAAQVSGTISGQTVTFSESLGGTTYNFTGTLSSSSSGSQAMAGTFEAPAGACFTQSTTGTWSATLIPPLTGNFTGTLSDSNYMAALTGVDPAAPIAVSGSFLQTPNTGSSNATVTGTITAVGYPCFTTVTLGGTISGQNVYLDVFGYNGEQVGTLGLPGVEGTGATPAIVTASAGEVSLLGNGEAGLALGVGSTGPCPPLIPPGESNPILQDTTSVVFNFQ